jgi:hypothetical protein
VTSGPASGTLVVNGDGTITYTPNAGFVGVDTFTYLACAAGQQQLCASATVTVTVAPSARPDVTRTSADVAIVIPVIDNDGGLLTPPAVTVAPVHGQAATSGPNAVLYTPNPGYTGVDLFTYEVCDAETSGLCDQAVVGIGVFPTAVDDTGETVQHQAVTVDVEANDTGADLVMSVLRAPSNGTAAVGSIVYMPNAGFVGTDTLDYRACSPNAPSLCDQATVRLTVVAPTPAPGPGPSPAPGPSGGGSSGGGSGGNLARTGSESIPLVEWGLALLAVGLLFSCLSRWTRRPRPRHAARA